MTSCPKSKITCDMPSARCYRETCPSSRILSHICNKGWGQKCRQYNLQTGDDYWQIKFANRHTVLQQLSWVFCCKVKTSCFIILSPQCDRIHVSTELKFRLKTGHTIIYLFWKLLHHTLRWTTLSLEQHSGNSSFICSFLVTKWNDTSHKCCGYFMLFKTQHCSCAYA
jgi:hypothetical protein